MGAEKAVYSEAKGLTLLCARRRAPLQPKSTFPINSRNQGKRDPFANHFLPTKKGVFSHDDSLPLRSAQALTLSYDDGVETDIELIRILDEYGILATFNLNSGCFAPEGTVYPAGTIHRRMSESAVKALYAGGRTKSPPTR